MLFTISITIQCANIVAPRGGPEDETPPVLDTANSSPNMVTNYVKSPITFLFDEWLELKDVSEQVIISPPLEHQLDVKLRKKTVVVNFHEDEVLKENTTYTINFGEAIRDFTEGNVPPRMRYVFSTGDAIDSLSLTAKLIDNVTKEPIEGALLMLYTNLADSVFYKSRPYFFAKSDTGGIAKIENIRPDTFKLVALADENLNYHLDEDSEQYAYFSQPIVLNPANKDSILGAIEMYKEEPELQNISERFTYGKVAINFNKTPYDLDYDIIGNPPTIIEQRVDGDSLLLWYQDTSTTAWSIILRGDTTLIDTVKVKSSTHMLPKLSGQITANQRRKVIEFGPDTTLTFRWSHPLADVNEAQFLIWQDSVSNVIPASFNIDQDNPHIIVVDANWEFPGEYQLSIGDSAVIDLFGTMNDSIGNIDVVTAEPKDFGEIEVNLNGLKENQHYLLKLVKGENVIRTHQLRDSEITTTPADSLGNVFINATTTFSYLKPNTLTLQVIEDDNNNGRWDSGSYQFGLLPERIFIKELSPLKANWELKVDFNL